MDRKKKIVVIEDDVYVQDLLEQLFSNKSEYEITNVGDGFSAFEVLDKSVPDLIFVDYMLPKVGGLEVCKRVRGDERTKNVPIIFISALASVLNIDKEKLGINSVIAKPFDITEVLNEVERLIGEKGIINGR